MILDQFGKTIQGTRANSIRAQVQRMLRARYDAAQTTDNNSRHWANADALSPSAANSLAVRQKLRQRARYECHENNSLAKGIILTLANDTIGIGPRLQVGMRAGVRTTEGLDSPEAQLERSWQAWCREIGLAAKLRTMRVSKCVDGEAFCVFHTNKKLRHPVKLDLKLIEADQVTTPHPVFARESQEIDGIKFDEDGNPAAYFILAEHPGSMSIQGVNQGKWWDAKDVIHWYREDRPGQRRGIPEITPALPLFSMRRRWFLASLDASETAANLAAVMYSDAPGLSADEIEDLEAFDPVDLERNHMLTLPRGWKAGQIKSEHPNTVFAEFDRAIVNEIARCVNMPYNIAAGNSSSYNYASGRLDHQVYYNAIDVDRAEIEAIILARVYVMWLNEAVVAEDALPAGLPPFDQLTTTYYWPRKHHVDPQKEANAATTLLGAGLLTDDQYLLSEGVDPEEHYAQLARQMERRKRLGIPLPGAAAPVEEEPADAKAHYHIAAAGDNESSLQLTCEQPVEFAAAAGEGKLPTFSMVAYTGGKMRPLGFGTDVVIDLGGLKVAAGKRPILLGHDTAKIVGHTDTITVEATSIKADGVISGASAAAIEVRDSAKAGFPWRASIGASIEKMVYVDAGERVTVNGKEFTGPLRVVRAGTLHEISFVPIAADNRTSAKVAATYHPGDSTMSFEDYLRAAGYDPATMTDEAKEGLRSAYEFHKKHKAPNPPAKPPEKLPVEAGSLQGSGTNQTTPEEPVDVVKATRKATAAELARTEAIVDICATYGEPKIKVGDKEVSLKIHATAEGWDAKETELYALRASRNQAPAVHARDSVSVDGNVIEAALCQAGGLRDIGKSFDDKTLQAAHSQFKGRLGLQELLLRAAHANGYKNNVYRVNDGNLREVLEAAFMKAAFSTLSISGHLSNTANKFMMAAWLAVEQVWDVISAKRNVSDFKATTTYRLTDNLEYEEVGNGGEIPHGTLGETSYTNQAKTYGKMLAITRTDIINDDLGALMQIPRMLGRGGALKLNKVFWTAFLDNASFFSAGNGNLISGGTSVLASAGLTSAITKFLKQTDENGNPLALTPKFLLVPPELKLTAEEIFASTVVLGPTTEKAMNKNVHAGKYQPITSAYLSSSAIANSSTTAWYLLGDPQDLPVIEVALLNGVANPTIESAEADFNTLGILYRGYHDFGVTKQEYRGGVKSAGA